MKKSKQMWILLIMIFVFVWIGGGCGQTGEPEGTYDINTIPDEIRAIKFDPHVNVNQGEDYYGEDQTVTIAEKVKGWKETGFNTIYLLAFFRDPSNGQMIYPSESVDCGYNVEKYGPDFLKELVKNAKSRG